ncbi:MAG: hypothetical protein KF835_12020 [Xanthobacteraceae bacterium]|nr:hypothetical protein [Xanthobacteraceae bacterium]
MLRTTLFSVALSALLTQNAIATTAITLVCKGSTTFSEPGKKLHTIEGIIQSIVVDLKKKTLSLESVPHTECCEITQINDHIVRFEAKISRTPPAKSSVITGQLNRISGETDWKEHVEAGPLATTILKCRAKDRLF